MARRGNSEPTDSNSTLSRRRLLQVGGATVATGLAGCQGGGEETTTTTDSGGDGNGGDGDGGNGGGGGTPVDDTFSTFTGANPTNSHYNPYNPAQYAGMKNVLYNQLWRYNGRTGEWHPRIGKELSIDGTTATVKIDTSYKWASDGKPVNADDLMLQIQLEKYLGMPMWNYIEGAKKVDSETIELEMSQEVNPTIFRQAINVHVQTKRGSEFQNWLKKMEEAGGEEARKQVVTEFQKWNYAKDSDDPVSNGPYSVKQAASSRWVLEWNKHFPTETNIPKFEFISSGSDQQHWQKFIGDRLDGAAILAVPESTRKQFPDHIKQIELPAMACYSPMFNFDNPVWGKRPARQAFAYLLDTKLVDRNINPRHSPLPYLSGLTTAQTQKNVGEDWVSQNLTNYYPESKPDKAAEKMKEAGFSKEGGKWMDENGDPITLEWVGPKFPGSVGFSETLSQVLPQFGIEYTGTLLAPPQWISRRKQENYDLTFNYIGGGPHPWYFLSAILTSTRSQFGNWPRETVKLPPIGKPDGELQEVDIKGILQQMVQTKDDAKLKELTRQYAWYVNQEIPVMPMTEAKWLSWMSYDDWKIPEPGADVMGIKSPIHQLYRETEEGSDQALIQAKTK